MLKVCICGHKGYWAAFLKRNIEKVPDMEIVCLVDKANTFEWPETANCSRPYIYKSLSNALKCSKFDLVVIATPPETHFSLAVESIQAGKHTLIEKPITTNSNNARSLVEMAKDYKVKLGVDHTFLFSSHIRVIKKLLDNGKIGEPLHIVSNRMNLGKFQNLGVVWDLMPHDIAMLNYLMGKKPKINHVELTSHVDASLYDVATISMSYDKVTCYMNLSWLHPKKIRTTTIVGTEGMIEYDMLADVPLSIYDKKANKTDQRWEHSFTWEAKYKGDFREPLEVMLEEFRDYCLDKSSFLADGEKGAEVVECIEKVLVR